MDTPRTITIASADYLAALYIFGLSLWILSWGPDQALSASTFDTLRHNTVSWGLGPPWRPVGIAGMVVSLSYAAAININGRGMYWTPIVRGMACLLAVLFLSNLSLSIAATQPSSTGVFSYMFAALAYSMLFILNLGRFAQSLELIWERVRGVFS